MSEQSNLPHLSRIDPGLSDQLPAILTSIAMLACVLDPEFCWNSVQVWLVFSLGFGSLSGLLFSLLIGPSLSWWRSALSGPIFILVSPVLIATIIVWNIQLLLLALALCAYPESPDLLASLDIVVSGLTAMDFLTVLSVGLLSCSLSRYLFAKKPELLNSVKVRFRPFVLAFCLLNLGAIGFFGNLLWRGMELDPELEELYIQRDGPRFPQADLPDSFRNSPELTAALSSERGRRFEDPGVWFKTYSVWLESMREQFKKDPSLSSKQAIVLADFAENHYRFRLETVYEAIPETAPEVIAEVHLLTDMALLESGRNYPLLCKFLSNIHLSESAWDRLIKIALQKPELELATPVNRVSVERYFLNAVRDLHRQATEGEKRPGPLELLNMRRNLNKTWNEFKDGLPYPRVPPHSPQDFRRMRGSESQLAEARNSAAWNDLERQDLVVAIILMELQRLKAAKQAIPREWSEFRPEVGALGRAYADWISLEFSAKEVSVKLDKFGSITDRKSFRISLPQVPGSQTQSQLSAADLSYGRKQVEHMLKNRPMMASLVNPDDPIYEWAAARFAGIGSGSRFFWNPVPPSGGYDSASEYAQGADVGYIQVEPIGLQAGKMTPERQWEAAIYALLDMENGPQRTLLKQQVVEGALSRDVYITKMSKLEYHTAQRLASFYSEQWLEHLTNRAISVEVNSWSRPVESWEKWRERPQLFNGHPDFVFRRQYDALLKQ